jgi:chitinase
MRIFSLMNHFKIVDATIAAVHYYADANFWRRITSVGLVGLAGFSAATHAQTKVVGYIPSYKNMPAVIDRTDLSKLTHLNLSFLNPNASGAVTSGGNPVCMEGASAGDINYVVQKAHQAGVKVLVSVAGGVIPPCSGNWQTLLQPASRTTLVNNLLQFVSTFNLDGLDVDIEGVVLTNIDNAGNYTPFIQALRNGLPAGKLLTSATASYVGGMVPTASLPYFDFVNIMSYDAIGPGWGPAGVEHSPYSMAVADINTWKARGLTKQKMVLGVPFYGYGFGGYSAAYDFSSIISQYGAGAAQADVIGTRCAGCSYITYNGIPTIRSKTQLALQEGSGVMIWELSQDVAGANSLLAAIHSQIGNGGGSSSSTSTLCPAWVSGQNYAVGDKVTYQGGYYIAEYANPGYIPTVSTYFWEPIAASACAGTGSSSSSSGAFTRLIEAEAYTSMSGVQLEPTADTGGGQNVGWIDANDWMAHANINFPASGTYRVEYRVASPSGSRLSLDLNAGALQLGQVNIPATGGWQSWATISHNVSINAGTYSVGIFAPLGGWNLNWIKFTKL